MAAVLLDTEPAHPDKYSKQTVSSWIYNQQYSPQLFIITTIHK